MAIQQSALHCVVIALAALLCGATPAAAACLNPHGLSIPNDWRRRTANANDATLRAAYAAGTCTWIDEPHDGGHAPACAFGSRHVTVSNGKRTCHVFRKENSHACRQMAHFPATCF